MEVAEKPKLALSDLTYDQLVVARSQLTEKIREAEAVADGFKQKREKIDAEFLTRFNAQGLTNVKTKHGTPYIVTYESFSVSDPETFKGWMRDNDAYDFSETRAKKDMMKSYKEQHNDLPPGISYSATLKIGVKKS